MNQIAGADKVYGRNQLGSSLFQELSDNLIQRKGRKEYKRPSVS